MTRRASAGDEIYSSAACTSAQSACCRGARTTPPAIWKPAWGVDFGDPNGDGRLDIIGTNFSHETNTLYVSSGEELFTDATNELGLGTTSLGKLGWVTRFVDLDNEGDGDLFVANGHVYPTVAESDDTTTYRQANQIFLNCGDGAFDGETVLEEVAPSCGAAFGDVDNGGDVDIVVVSIDEAPSLLRTDIDGGHWGGSRARGTSEQPRRRRCPRAAQQRRAPPGEGRQSTRPEVFFLPAIRESTAAWEPQALLTRYESAGQGATKRH